MPAHVTLSSELHDWRTPPWFLDLVRGVGPIVLDPATSPDNPTRADTFFAPGLTSASEGRHLGECGLRGDWSRVGLAFINPPYGRYLSGPVEPDYVMTQKCPSCLGDGFVAPIAHHDLWTPETRLCHACGSSGREVIGHGRGWAARIAQDRGEWITLVPVRTETDWWGTLLDASDRCLLWGSKEHGKRINFVDPRTGKEKKGSNLASCVFYRGPQVDLFCDVFGEHGRLIMEV